MVGTQHRMNTETRDGSDDRPLRSYGRRKGKRLTARKQQEKITAVVILAEGGGIRSAVHVSQLLSQTDSLLAANKNRPRSLLQDAYVLAGVSGVAVALSAYLAASAQEPDDPILRARLIDDALGVDHMTPLVAGMFGSDLLGIILPLDLIGRMNRAMSARSYVERPNRPLIDGRTEFFERSLEAPWGKQDGAQGTTENWMKAPLAETVLAATGSEPYAGEPIVVFPTFGVEGGVKAVSSNVVFGVCGDDAAGFVDVLSCLGLSKGYDPRLARTDIPLNAAAHLSARFPGSNPPAIFDVCDENGSDSLACSVRRLRFVDGGYFDNSGAAAASEAVRALVRAVEDVDPGGTEGLQDKLHIVVVHAYFRNEETSSGAGIGLNEVLAPLDAVWASRAKSGQWPVASFCRDLAALAGAQHMTNCSALAADRTFSSGAIVGSHPQDNRLPQVEHSAQDAPLQHPGPVVTWISAPVDNARSVSAVDHYLLGWSMRRETRCKMFDATAPMSQRVAKSLGGIRPLTPWTLETGPPTEPEVTDIRRLKESMCADSGG